MKVLFTYDYGKENFDKVRALGYELIYRSEKDLVIDDEIRDIEIFQCYNAFNKIDIDDFTHLKYIQLSSIGFDQVPPEKIINRGITLCNNHGGYSVPIGEWVVSKILEIYKRARYINNNQKNKTWKMDLEVDEILGKKVLFLGTGTLALESARRLQGFGLEIVGMNSSGRDVEFFDRTFKKDTLAAELKNTDIVVSCLPSTDSTYNFINDDFIDMLNDNVVLINVSRGSVVDEDAIVRKASKFKGIALDVFKEEPLSKDSKLWDIDNVYISSHNSWVSSNRNERRFKMIYDNLVLYKNGEELNNVVDIERGY